MSAALTLPYVWATATKERAERDRLVSAPDELAFYRKRTETVLRRYLHASLMVGRVPSIMGDVTLRGRATNSRKKNFEDVVIFAIDVEKCLKVLEPKALQLIVKIALQEYMFMEVAKQVDQDIRTVARCYRRSLDQLTAEFLRRKLFDAEE